MSRFHVLACVLLAAAGCQSSSLPPPALNGGVVPAESTGFASGLYWRPGPVPGQRFAILLPGASGLKIFDDEGHYFRVADALNEAGFDVLVVDYKRAYKASPDRPSVPTGQKIAWVIGRSIQWARQEGRIVDNEPGTVIAWSLGAEGLWPLLPDKDRLGALNVRAAAAYYPANEDQAKITTTVPVLLLSGEADDVTPLAELRQSVAKGNSPFIQVRTFAGAHHGFDITSIQPAKTVRLVPVIGPSATFGYQQEAAQAAWKELQAFLNQHVHPRSAGE